MGKKEFTFLKMLEYGFWPKDLPTPYEREASLSPEEKSEQKKLTTELKKLGTKLSKVYKDKNKIDKKLRELRKKWDDTWDFEKLKKIIAKQIFEESKKRRAEKKRIRELEKKARSEAWQKKKKEEIVFVGKGFSSLLNQFDVDKEKLSTFGLPEIKNGKELASFLNVDFVKLRFLAYHRDVVSIDHYIRYKIPKKSGGTRIIAAPMPILKRVQRAILDKVLSNIPVSDHAHGFLKAKSVVSNASQHPQQPRLVINLDLKDFFPTVTFERVRGMFLGLGFSGHTSTILAIICTYCERIPIQVKNKMKYVAVSGRVLPQGSPASPMITNIVCWKLDNRLKGLATKFGFNYTRYADDLSFSLSTEDNVPIGRFLGLIHQIVEEEGFKVNKLKTRFLRKNNRQEITGIVINGASLGLPRKWIRRFRAAIHNARKKGEKLTQEVRNELSGMAAWVSSVNSEKYSNLLKDCYGVLSGTIKTKELDLGKRDKEKDEKLKEVKPRKRRRKKPGKKTIVDFFG